MYQFYTDNKNQQITIALLKDYGIKKVIASPGGTNPALLVSMQLSGYFEMYSCVDERSAAYMACGMSEESNEPVVLCCTGATASRNYMPALTEAFYRKLPIIVLTCSRPNRYIGQLMPQVTDRSKYLGDIYVAGEQLQDVRNQDDYNECIYKVNKVLHACQRNGGGPVHLNLECGTQSCNTKALPSVHKITRISDPSEGPRISTKGKIGIFIGSHKRIDNDETSLIERFCAKFNAVVFCDHTSGYYGNFKIQYSLIGTQIKHKFDIANLDLLIDLGEISGDYFAKDDIKGLVVWRVNEDGEIRIRFNKLDCLFHMNEKSFFRHYLQEESGSNIDSVSFYNQCAAIYKQIYSAIPNLPLCHISVAKEMAPNLPNNSVLHLAIMNALRSWNFFYIDSTIGTNCNVGGFGIDGCTSSTIGASLVHPEKLYFLVTGDLAFFYDLNSLGNRHIGKNLRILLVNDGKGAEFKHFKSVNHSVGIDDFVAGAGHFGCKSHSLVRQYVVNLGFDYMKADNWDEFKLNLNQFVSPSIGDAPLFFEIFSDTENQSEAWYKISNIATPSIEELAKQQAKKILTANTKNILKKFFK